MTVAAAVPWDRLAKTAVALDLRYGALETPFLQAARGVGIRAVDGLGLLVYQGARSYELWNMAKAPRDVMEQAVREHLGLVVPEG